MYNSKKSLPGIYRYILEYIIWLNRVLTDLEQAGCTISGTKSIFYKDKIIIVSYCYNRKGRCPDKSKIITIIYWKDYKDIILA